MKPDKLSASTATKRLLVPFGFRLCWIDDDRRGGADLDIGGQDLGLVMSIGNTVANLPGVIVPAVGAWCRHRYGSFAPLFAGVASLHLLAAVAFRLAKNDENMRSS